VVAQKVALVRCVHDYGVVRDVELVQCGEHAPCVVIKAGDAPKEVAGDLLVLPERQFIAGQSVEWRLLEAIERHAGYSHHRLTCGGGSIRTVVEKRLSQRDFLRVEAGVGVVPLSRNVRGVM